ncbi:MAG: hypothetical protein J6A59_13860 [Lachnospiraceae bacterium]|nr:hypothetical protein [Lachnospiraceae bacterium]
MARTSKNMVDECKKYIGNFYVNGEWLEEPTKIRMNGRDVEPRVMDYMYNLFRFLIEGTMLCDCTLMWLKSNLPSIQATFELYNDQHTEIEAINLNTAHSKILYDKNKLAKYFDTDILFHVMVDPDRYLDKAVETLEKLMRVYMDDSEYRKASILKLPKDIICKDIDSYSWAKLTEILGRYSKDRIKLIESGEDKEMTREMIGYFNYLISNKKLSKKEKTRLEQVRIVLGLGE